MKTDISFALAVQKIQTKMQMRFDERLGFPGGHVNNGEDTVTGLNRKMQEKIGLDISRYGFTENNYVVTYIHDKKKFVLHFFAKKISSEELKDIECNCVYAQEYGREALGCVRPHLYTKDDNIKGFPAFLCGQFAGNAKEELLFGLVHAHLFTKQETKQIFKFSDEMCNNINLV